MQQAFILIVYPILNAGLRTCVVPKDFRRKLYFSNIDGTIVISLGI